MFCDWQADSIHLTIGYHQLEGKRVSLKKPFAILETQCDSEHSGQHIMKASQSLWAATARALSLVTAFPVVRLQRLPTPCVQALLHIALHLVAASALPE